MIVMTQKNPEANIRESSRDSEILEVDDSEIIPKIKIYEPDGSYWFRKIGFNRKITDK